MNNPKAEASAVPGMVQPARGKWLNRNVLGAGITSALGDIAHESTTAILPGFLAVLGLPAAPALLGTVEGISDATASFTKLGAGYLADRLGHRKTLTVVGYALTSAAQALYALAHGWPLILLGRMIAWFGRGVRGPLRDAILAESIAEQDRGKAFGFHRAADTVGAVIGPLVGVTILHVAQRNISTGNPVIPFRLVFWASLIPGFLAAINFAAFVKEHRRPANHALRFWATVRDLPQAFRRYLFAVGIFGAGDFAPTLLILAATQLLAPHWGAGPAAAFAAGLYLWRNIVYAAASWPVGALADWIGHRPVLVAGYVLGAVTAFATAAAFVGSAATAGLLIAVFTLAGLYIAVEDALEGSMTAEFVAPAVRGIGYGVLGTVNGVGDFVASALVGWLWFVVSPTAAFTAAGILMGVGAWLLAADGKSRSMPP
jgi:MFS family permease